MAKREIIKKRFATMEIGEQFEIYCDSDFYITAYKVDADHYVDNQHGFRQEPGKYDDVKLDEEYEIIGKVPIHDKPTEIERVTCTLLANKTPMHPVFHAYVKALLADPAMYQDMRNWWISIRETEEGQAIEKDCVQMGYAPELSKPFGMNEGMYDGLHAKIINHMAFPKTDDKIQQLLEWEEEAILRLVSYLVEYRERGRIDGDYEEHMALTGDSGITFTTSLAAGIVEYHDSMMNVAAMETERSVDRAVKQERMKTSAH
jgi:hypothetical protein